MSLHLDYRPQNTNEIIGNQDTVLKLEKQLLNPDGPHVFLFSGTRGCGKTTLARIATQLIGCNEKDIQEIDVANNRGKDDATQLKNGVRFLPMFGKTKAYILDEVHQGTPAYFNALLKTLEDTPKHVYFFLCTTDPQKVLTTVKSRCSQYSVEPLTQKEIVELLEWVIAEEMVDIHKSELKKISEVCEGIPREALIILDQIIDLEPADRLKAIENTKVRERELKELCTALLEGKSWKVVSKILKDLKGEPESIRHGIMGYMNAVLLNNNENAALIMEEFRTPCYTKAELTLSAYMSATVKII
jgi:DNA polymerase-3 subunit gamma/tau